MKQNWFPGLMAKEEKRLKENLKLVDLVVEVLDARIPLTSMNSKLQEIIGGKRIVVLNKSDLAEEDITGRWVKLLSEGECPVLAFNTQTSSHIKKLEKILKGYRPGKSRFKRPLRLMVAGIPNVGKSSIINRLTGKFTARTGGEPGITRGAQWIKLRAGWEMLDTPGLLVPSMEKDENVLALAAIGSISYRVVDVENVARWLLSKFVSFNKVSVLADYYSLAVSGDITPETLFLHIAQNRGCLTKGGKVDDEKTAQLILRDFKKGVLGRITLERPEEYGQIS